MPNEELQKDYMNRPGVYFLKSTNSYCVGSTHNLNEILFTHNKNKDILTIIFAAYKSQIDRLDKKQIKDLETHLIDYAKDLGLTLGKKIQNKKQELKKSLSVASNKEKVIVHKEKAINHFTKIINPEKSKTHKSDLFFNYVPYRHTPTKAYTIYRPIFKKQLCKQALFLYLYKSIANDQIDVKLTGNTHLKGWIAGATLAFFRIETNGKARGILQNKLSITEAQEKINLFVEKNY